MLRPASYAMAHWIEPGSAAQPVIGPVAGEQIALAGGAPLDVQGMLDWARSVGGPALRRMTFHDRARMIKNVATYLNDRKEELYAINHDRGDAPGWGRDIAAASEPCSLSPPRAVAKCLMVTCMSMGRLRAQPAARFSDTTSPYRCRALPFISTPSTFRSGECWKNWQPSGRCACHCETGHADLLSDRSVFPHDR